MHSPDYVPVRGPARVPATDQQCIEIPHPKQHTSCRVAYIVNRHHASITVPP